MDDHVIVNSLLNEPYTVCVCGVGYRGGQPRPGVEEGPKVIREAGLMPALEGLGWNIEDLGNLEFKTYTPEEDPPASNGVKNPRSVGGACEKVFQTVYKVGQQGQLALTIGGDHSLAIGTISGTLRAWRGNLGIIWVDAHGDINTPETSPSGNLHGMPVAFLMRLVSAANIPGFEWMDETNVPRLSSDQIVFIGLRDVDPGEKRLLRKLGIKVFSMMEVDKFGIGKVMDMAIEHIMKGEDPRNPRAIHLSYDVDGIDPNEVPSTGTTVKGGLSYREGRHICERVAETGRLVGLDIVEVNPALGTEADVKKTAEVAVDLAKSALGMRLW
jgi:arginase